MTAVSRTLTRMDPLLFIGGRRIAFRKMKTPDDYGSG